MPSFLTPHKPFNRPFNKPFNGSFRGPSRGPFKKLFNIFLGNISDKISHCPCFLSFDFSSFKISFRFIGIFLLLILISPLILALQIKGTAHDTKTNQILYTEIHDVELTNNGLNKKITTKYYKPDRTFFAIIESDFSKNLLIPDVKFQDLRFKTQDTTIFNPSKSKLVFTSLHPEKKIISKEVTTNDKMVLGQGFDNFIKINFEALSSKGKGFLFGVLSEMDFFSFKGYKQKDSDNNIIQFGFKLSSIFLRVFTTELVIEYNKSNKQLHTFKGLSNLVSDDQKSQTVLIKYEYPNNPQSP